MRNKQMFTQSKSEAPYRERKGLISYILLQHGDVPRDRLSITWVDVLPGSEQSLHSHTPEQVYIIIRGKGRMTIDTEKREVAEGDLVYIPSNENHSIKNISNDVLSYISAATPAFNLKALYDSGDLKKSL